MDATGRFMRIPRDREAVDRARGWLERRAAGLPPEARAEVVLLGHELVTNAVKYSEGDHVWISFLATDEVVRIEVADQGGTSVPAVLPEVPYSTSGRGLRWVDELADEWGVENGAAREVWFQIHLDQQDHELQDA